MICPTCIGHVQFADQIEYYEALDRFWQEVIRRVEAGRN
jgi:hypothetical protein